MSELKKAFERLMEFAEQQKFQKPFSQVYFAEDKSIHRFFDSDKPAILQDYQLSSNLGLSWRKLCKRSRSKKLTAN